MNSRWFVAILLALVLLPAFAVVGSGEPGAIHVAEVRQAITPATADFIRKSLERAIIDQAEVLIIELDTPGGLLESTREIVQLLLNSPLPVVVYISPAGARGASAGTMITLASHVAAMAPATHMGAAHPVSLFGWGGDNKVMGEKIVNDTAAFIESIARLRGRNIEWAISAVRESKTITAEKALEQKVVELIAENLTDLVRQLDGREVRLSASKSIHLETIGRPIVRLDMSFTQDFMSLVSNPNLIFLLFIIGMVGLYIELSNPGLFLPGIIGAVSLLMALIAMQTLPVSYGALALMLLGVALLVAESFVPSFGVLGIGGLASMLVGSIFLLDSTMTDLRISLATILGAVGTTGVIALVVGKLVVKSFKTPLRSFQDNMVGQQARVRSQITPGSHGQVFLNGELWKAQAHTLVEIGELVTVEAVAGLLLTVTRQTAEREREPPAEITSDKSN